MLRDIEYLATLASIHANDYKYPKKDLDDMWENVLLYFATFLRSDYEGVNSMMCCLEVQLRWSTKMQVR